MEVDCPSPILFPFIIDRLETKLKPGIPGNWIFLGIRLYCSGIVSYATPIEKGFTRKGVGWISMNRISRESLIQWLPQAPWLILSVLLFALPLTATTLAHHMFEVPKVFVLRIGMVGLVVAVLAQVFTRQFAYSPVNWRKWLFGFLFLYLVSLSISTVLSVDWTRSLIGTYDRQNGALTVFCYAAVSGFVLLSRPPVWFVFSVPLLYCAAGIVSGFIGLGQWYGFGWLPGYVVFTQTRPHGTFHYVNTLACFLILSILFGWGFVGLVSRKKWLVAGLLFLHLLLWSTFCRGAWLCVFAGIAGILLWNGVVWGWKSVLRVLAVAGVVVGLSIPLFYLVRPPAGDSASPDYAVFSKIGLFGRMASSADREDSTVTSRYAFWNSAVQSIRLYPWFGSGPETFHLLYPRFRPVSEGYKSGFSTVVENAHNLLLHTAATQGLVSLAFWLLLFGCVGVMALYTLFYSPRGVLIYVYGLWFGVWCLSLASQQLNPHSLEGNLFEWLALGVLGNSSWLDESPSRTIGIIPTVGWKRFLEYAALFLIAWTLFAVGSFCADVVFLRGYYHLAARPAYAFRLLKLAGTLAPWEELYRERWAEKIMENPQQEFPAREQSAQAWSIYDRLVRCHPENGAYVWGRAKAAWWRAQVDNPTWLDAAMNDIQYLSRFSGAFPQSEALAARIEAEKKNWDSARVHIQKARQMEPKNLTIPHIEACIEQAAGNIPAAEALYRQILDEEGGRYNTRYNLALLLWDTGRRDEAVEQLQQAIHTMPNYQKAYIRLAWMLKELKRVDDLMALLLQAPDWIRKTPEMSSILKNDQSPPVPPASWMEP